MSKTSAIVVGYADLMKGILKAIKFKPLK
jgi:hypothetical protein